MIFSISSCLRWTVIDLIFSVKYKDEECFFYHLQLFAGILHPYAQRDYRTNVLAIKIQLNVLSLFIWYCSKIIFKKWTQYDLEWTMFSVFISLDNSKFFLLLFNLPLTKSNLYYYSDEHRIMQTFMQICCLLIKKILSTFFFAISGMSSFWQFTG